MGYAETSSATEHFIILAMVYLFYFYVDGAMGNLTAMHMQPAPEINQHQTAAADPPASKGKMKVVMIVENRPLILTANEKVDRYPNSLLKTGL